VAVLNRRTVLAAMGGVAVAPAISMSLPATVAFATDDLYPSNTAIYADPALVEGTDYIRRYRRHEALDTSVSAPLLFPDTLVFALHGGAIEFGTSELCLAVAGYHPNGLVPTPAAGPAYDYWMFEGVRASNNGDLHVTSTHCDDPVLLSLAAGARRTVSLHGCSTATAGVADGAAAVLVGGLDTALKSKLMTGYAAAGITAVDATPITELKGDEPTNIVNRTLTGCGAQLELTPPLRSAMFTTNTIGGRKGSTTAAFWQFVDVTRAALAG